MLQVPGLDSVLGARDASSRPWWAVNPGAVRVERIRMPSPDEFHERYVVPGLPVVITGMNDDLPAFQKWTPSYLRERYGDREVPVGLIDERGKLRFDENDRVIFDTTTFGKFVDTLEAALAAGRVHESYVMFKIIDFLPELLDDLRTPPVAPPAPWSFHKFWLSGPGTATPLHHDLPDNLFSQIYGKKRLTLFAPRDELHMYRYPPWTPLPQASRLTDCESVDARRFPRFRGARPIPVEVSAGEVLYLPRYWWHQVRSLETSISVNYWWCTGVNYAIARCAMVYQKMRQLKY